MAGRAPEAIEKLRSLRVYRRHEAEPPLYRNGQPDRGPFNRLLRAGTRDSGYNPDEQGGMAGPRERLS